MGKILFVLLVSLVCGYSSTLAQEPDSPMPASMADSLAGKGEMKPEAMEEELGSLLCEVLETYTKDIAPALYGPRFVTGKDLIEIFSLQPGPFFSKILDDLQEAQVEGEVKNREDALA